MSINIEKKTENREKSDILVKKIIIVPKFVDFQL